MHRNGPLPQVCFDRTTGACNSLVVLVKILLFRAGFFRLRRNYVQLSHPDAQFFLEFVQGQIAEVIVGRAISGEVSWLLATEAQRTRCHFSRRVQVHGNGMAGGRRDVGVPCFSEGRSYADDGGSDRAGSRSCGLVSGGGGESLICGTIFIHGPC